ncbi:hypothetical protein C8046_01130 [Serinibacter arcticus]|uniref:DUF732 domain-containing protein n=1 Tax=Serinibacter arcticus TaxID=1655435 RepID=A0A2U1ZRB0_9MICO|nr:hypothetical protein [Serinibacter arcticus]PWD49529.1 hypothetical protein C8046_01130 [Serinibacter arcticus]
MSKRNIFLVLPMAAALALSACGGGSGGAERPSADEIADVFTSGAEELGGVALPEEQATCIAEALEASDVSDETLRAMVDLDEDYSPSDEETTLFTDTITSAATECVTG